MPTPFVQSLKVVISKIPGYSILALLEFGNCGQLVVLYVNMMWMQKKTKKELTFMWVVSSVHSGGRCTSRGNTTKQTYAKDELEVSCVMYSAYLHMHSQCWGPKYTKFLPLEIADVNKICLHHVLKILNNQWITGSAQVKISSTLYSKQIFSITSESSWWVNYSLFLR